MKYWLIILIFFSACTACSASITYAAYTTKDNLTCAYGILPSSDLRTCSWSLSLTLPVRPRTGFQIDYLSLGGPLFMSESYAVTYRLLYGLEKWGNGWPTLLFGWRIIDTPETDLIAPLDFGMEYEIPLSDDQTLRLPVMISLFSKDNMLDASIIFERKGFWPGNFTLGLRDLKPYGSSQFVERLMLILGFVTRF